MRLRILYEYGVRKTVHKLLVSVFSATHRLIRTVRRSDSPTHVRTAYGVLMRARWEDRTFRYCYYGTYGRALSGLISGMKTEFVFLDIGANQGLYTLIAASNPKCQAVLAFEPVQSTFAVLEDNVTANGLGSHVTCVQAAVSDQKGEAEVAVNAAHSGAASMARKSNFDPTHTEKIALVSIAEVDALIPPAGDIVIKLDVEGHEDVVVRELVKSVHSSRIKAIFYEIDEQWNDAAEIRKTLEQAGFGRFTKLGVRHHYDVLAQR